MRLLGYKRPAHQIRRALPWTVAYISRQHGRYVLSRHRTRRAAKVALRRRRATSRIPFAYDIFRLALLVVIPWTIIGALLK